MRSLFLRVLLFTLLVPGSVTGWIPFFLLPLGGRLATHGVPGGLGIALAGLGLATYAWCAWEFARKGRGTPGPHDPPRKLVVTGLYRYTRNPMYLGIGAILLGEALLFPAAARLAYALIACGLFHLWIIAFEEPTLRRQFGKAYAAYCNRVGRWL